MTLSLDPGSGAFAGLDLGHDGVRVVVVDRAGGRVDGAHAAVDVDTDETAALDAVERLVRACLGPQRLLGAGAAVAAPRGVLPGWDRDVAEALRHRLGVPVTAGNDANLGALAEATYGAAGEDCLYVMLSAGVGLGMLLRGRLYEGASGVAGELGHVVVEPGGDPCRCGDRGCLETVAGTDALLSATGETALEGLLARVARGDKAALGAVQDAAARVGTTVAAIARVLDPACIVVGGELAAAGPAVLAPMRAAFARWEQPPRIILGTLGPEAEALGAAASAMRASAIIAKEQL